MRAFTVCLLACMAVSAYGIASYNTASEKIQNRYLVALNVSIKNQVIRRKYTVAHIDVVVFSYLFSWHDCDNMDFS